MRPVDVLESTGRPPPGIVRRVDEVCTVHRAPRRSVETVGSRRKHPANVRHQGEQVSAKIAAYGSRLLSMGAASGGTTEKGG